MPVPEFRPDQFDSMPILRPLLEAVPEFRPVYADLATACGDEPGEPSVLMELAEFLATQVAAEQRERPLVDRVLAIVETRLESVAEDEHGCELVAYAFFDTLDPEVRRALVPRAGPLSRTIIEELDAAVTSGDY